MSTHTQCIKYVDFKTHELTVLDRSCYLSESHLNVSRLEDQSSLYTLRPTVTLVPSIATVFQESLNIPDLR